MYNGCGVSFTAEDAKTFIGLQKIFVVIGKHKARCEMTLVPFPEAAPAGARVGTWEQTTGPLTYTTVLRKELQKLSKKWKAYQRRREKQGKSSADWIVPDDEVAYLKPICETLIPYSY